MRSNAQSLVFNPLDRRKDTSYGGSSNFERSNVLPVLGPRSGGDALLVGLLIAVSAEFGAVDPPPCISPQFSHLYSWDLAT